MFLHLTQVTINLRERKESISQANDFATVVEGLLNSILLVGAILTFAYMLWGGIDWILAGGDTGKVESARKKITQSILGLVVLACTFMIFMVVQYVLGLDVFGSIGGEPQPVCQGDNCITP